MKRILTVIGARPQFIKAAAVFCLCAISLFFACHNQSTPPVANRVMLTLLSSPGEQIGIMIDDSLHATPVNITVESGILISLQITDTLVLDSSAIFSGPSLRRRFIGWSDGTLDNSRNVILQSDTTFTAQVVTECKVKITTTPADLNPELNFYGWYQKGDTAALTAPPIKGYAFKKWVVNGNAADSSDTFYAHIVKPSIISAHYVRRFLITVATNSDIRLLASIDSVQRSTPFTVSVDSGEIVSMHIPSPQEFDQDSLIDGVDTRYTFGAWSDFETANPRTITVFKDLSFTARMSTKYRVIAQTEPAGLAHIQGAGWRDAGNTHNLVAPTVAGSVFAGWKINGQVAGDQTQLLVEIGGPILVNAIYHPDTSKCYITIKSLPDMGLPVKIDSVYYTTPITLSLSIGAVIKVEMPLVQDFDNDSLVTGNDTRYVFFSWNDGETSSVRNFVLNRNITLTAQMNIAYKAEVITEPSGIIISEGAGWHNSGAIIALEAKPEQGFIFDQWLLNAVNVLISTKINIIINEPKSIRAIYKKACTISFSSYPDSGFPLKVNGLLAITPTIMTVKAGSRISIHVDSILELDRSPYVPGFDSRYAFVSWNDNVQTTGRTITVDYDTSIVTMFSAQYKVETGTLPQSVGMISATPVSESGWFERGKEVLFSAPFEAFYFLSYWEINNERRSDTGFTITRRINAPLALSAIYESNWQGQPFTYHAYLTNIEYLQPTAYSSNERELPNTLIIAPGYYSYNNYVYNMTKEGLFRFSNNYQDQQQRIVYKKDLYALLSSISWIVTPGKIDLALTSEEKTQKALTSKLSMQCSEIVSWALHLLNSVGITQAREWAIDNKFSVHNVFEIYRPEYNRWVLYDLNQNAYFKRNRSPVSFLELVNLVQNNLEYDLALLSEDAGIDLRNDTQFGIGQDVAATKHYYSQFLKHFPMLINNIMYPTTDSIKAAFYN